MPVTEQQTAIIQQGVRSLLSQGIVDVFIGYKSGSNPLRISPHAISDAAEADSLVWNLLCANNLAAALKKHADKKVGILLKGCDSRSIIELLKLHQVRRENLYIIGVPCTGMLDAKKLAQHCTPANVKTLADHGDKIVIHEQGGGIIACEREPLLVEKCKTCSTPNPLLVDVQVGDELAAPAADPSAQYADVEHLESLDAAGRFAFWKQQLGACTLCYACQTVCPLCFCSECALTLPKSQRKQRSTADVFAFHMNRAYHMAGKCTGCMECERVCPANIPLGTIFKKVQKDTQELFDYSAGSDLAALPPLSTFAAHDEERSTQ